MLTIRQWRRCIAWLALAAVLAAACLPTVAHALSGGKRIDDMLRVGICTPGGMRYDAAVDNDGKVPAKDIGHTNDCPYCRLASDLPALPSAGLFLAPAASAAPRPALFYHAPTPSLAWAAAKPRGPPLRA